MDFGSILNAAQKNEKSSSSASFYKTKFEPPKKENKTRTLSSNIQKFLAKKEEEEKSKAEETKKKRNELLAMRDTKANNKIKKMLKVIKSANKSVLEDAVDNVNTAVTVNGPDQPDEDDYGYVSQEASAFYSKMMDKYKNIPDEDKKFSSSKKVTNFDLSSTKDRVRAAILRHQEEESLPHKRKRRSHNGTSDRPISPDYSHEEDVKKEEKPKPRRPPPPPLDFSELLKIAEKKQFEPVVEAKKPEKTEEPERLMTKKQKREQEELKAFREAKLKRDQEKALRAEGSTSTSMKKPAPVPPPPRPKPTNPLQIRIPKLSDKANADAKKPSSTTALSEKSKVSLNDKDQSRSSSASSKDRSSRDENGKRSETKTDINKNMKPPISKSNFPSRNSEKPAIKPPINKSSSDLRPSSSSGTLNKSKDLSKSDGKPDMNRKSLSEKSSSDSAKSKPQVAFGNKTSSNVSKSISTPIKSTSNHPNQKTPTQLPISKQTKPEASKDSRKLDPKSRPVPTSKVDEKKPTVTDQKARPPIPPAKGVALTPRELLQRRLAAEAAKEKSNSEVKKTLKPNNPTAQPKVAGKQPASSSSNAVRQFPPADVKGVRQFPPADVKKARQFPPSDMQRSRQFPPKDMAGKKEKPPPFKRKILDEDDSEYDSELDDFIDDGPEDRNDYSKYIKEIFGYDKSRYKDADEDDRNMESNFSQVMREEYISKKIGIMEDLEDMKMEAMEKKKKTQTNKRRRIDDD